MRCTLKVSGQTWLTPETFEIRFARPAGFVFLPGQKIRLAQADINRDYTLTNAPQAEHLSLLVRHIPHGRFSPLLAQAAVGSSFAMEGPFGYFGMQASPRPAVWVATGTGIAPFVAFARDGRRCALLLHGVRYPHERYFYEELARAAAQYVGCLTGASADPALGRRGRVTNYLEQVLPPGDYDFYLCGRSEMLSTATAIIDRKFPASHVFMETFF